jgi:hypothetical protein
MNSLPGFVAQIACMLVNLLPVAALAAFVLAGVRLRSEGGVNYEAGGGFFKWLFWGALLLTLPAVFSVTLPALFSGVPAATFSTSSSGTFGTVGGNITTGITSFVINIVIGRLVPLIAAALCFKAILDTTEGHSPLPSIISALFVLGAQAFWSKLGGSATATTTSTVAFSTADTLHSMFDYLANTIGPYVAVLCFVGAAINYQRSKPWGTIVFAGLAFLSFSGLWSLVSSWATNGGGTAISW